MNRFNSFVFFVIIEIFILMSGCRQEPEPALNGEKYFKLLGGSIEQSEFSSAIKKEAHENYPKSLVFNYRIDDHVTIYGNKVAKVLLNVKKDTVRAINFLIDADQQFLNSVIKSLGNPSNGGGIGVQENSLVLATTFFWKADQGCFSLFRGSIRRFGESGEFSYNTVFTLFDCQPSSVLPSVADSR